MSDEPVSIVIPSFNGKELLEEHLPSVVEALETYPGGGEIIVSDDGSTDGTAEWLKDNHIGVKVELSGENRGFGAAANMGARASSYEYVLLLNNDMYPENGFISPLNKRINSSDDCFAVCSRSIVPDGSDESPTRLEWEGDIITLTQPGLGVSEKPFDSAVTVAYAPGGMSLFRRERFLELGGIDSLFRPFYWEDADLGWRAWKAGWKIVYEPESTVRHSSHATIGRFYDRGYFELINQAHRHLFNMRHLEWPLLEKYLWKVNLLASQINAYDNGVERRAFYKALQRLDELMKRRRSERNHSRSTEEILELAANRPVD